MFTGLYYVYGNLKLVWTTELIKMQIWKQDFDVRVGS